MSRKSVIREIRRGRDQDASSLLKASHRCCYSDAEEPPNFSRLPVTINKGIWPTKRIVINENVVWVSRRLFRDWEEPLSNFHHIECKRVTPNDPSIGRIIYIVSLNHPNWQKSFYRKTFRLTLYQFVDPRFAMSGFLKNMSNVLSMPVETIEEEWSLMW